MEPDPILERVRRAIALNRKPGLNFPAHYLALAHGRAARGRSRAWLDNGPHCADPDGQMNPGALALLADMALAASLRDAVGPTGRVATVSMALQFTGASRTGRIEARASFDGFFEKGAERQGLARVELRDDGSRLVAAGHGAFMVIGDSGTTPRTAPPRDEEVLDHARKALAMRDGHSFLQRFWGYRPRRTAGGASCRAWNGPHIGNRVGHAQGGVTFGMAAATASAALPHTWALVGASAWYVGPGLGHRLAARSRIVHHGLSTAVVRTRITDERGRGVLELVSSHARA